MFSSLAFFSSCFDTAKSLGIMVAVKLTRFNILLKKENIMLRMNVARMWIWTTLASMAIAASAIAPTAIGQDKPEDAKPAATSKKKSKGRLPAHYRKVVDQKQRETIYGIQKEYSAQIKDLRAQLAALIKQRNAKIAAVLSPQQQKKVEQAAAAAKAKREAAKAGIK